MGHIFLNKNSEAILPTLYHTHTHTHTNTDASCTEISMNWTLWTPVLHSVRL